MFKDNESLIIARRESGEYAGIGGVGITVSGKLMMVEDFAELPVDPGFTRVVENPFVDSALTAPIKLYFDPTLVCGLKCPFCLAGVPTTRNNHSSVPSLSEGEVSHINDQIIEAGVLQVKMGGGEPFIYNPFWRSVEQLGEAGLGLSTSTSGVTLTNERLLSNEQIGLLAKHRVKVSLSVDGDPEYHDKIRGIPGLLEKALDGGIQRLRDGGVDGAKIEYRATISSDPESLKQLDFLAGLSQRTQTLIRIRLARPYGSALDNDMGIVRLTPEVIELMKDLRQYAVDNPLINIDPFLNFDKPAGIRTGMDCGGGTRQCNIDAKGRFFPCGALDGFTNKAHDLLAGDMTLLEYWQIGEAFIDIRGFYKRENEKSDCRDCIFVDACQGGCPSVRMSQNADVNPLCPKGLI